MLNDQTLYVANCAIEHQIIDPETKETTWELVESMTITEPTIELLNESAYMYIGRPERLENVLAIRLTGTTELLRQTQHDVFDYKDSVSLQLRILRERSSTRYYDNLVSIRTAQPKQGERMSNRHQSY